MTKLSNKKIAIVAADGFEESELFSPLEALKGEGAQIHVLSPDGKEIQGVRHMKSGKSIKADKAIADADINDYDGVLIPGGLFSPDALRGDDKALAFVRDAFALKLPVAAICHGPQVLISAELVKGRKMTGYKAIQIDLKNAGAEVSDVEVVVDQGLVTSRSPDDLPAFNKKIIEEFAEGKHTGRKNPIAA